MEGTLDGDSLKVTQLVSQVQGLQVDLVVSLLPPSTTPLELKSLQ